MREGAREGGRMNGLTAGWVDPWLVLDGWVVFNRQSRLSGPLGRGRSGLLIAGLADPILHHAPFPTLAWPLSRSHGRQATAAMEAGSDADVGVMDPSKIPPLPGMLCPQPDLWLAAWPPGCLSACPPVRLSAWLPGCVAAWATGCCAA